MLCFSVKFPSIYLQGPSTNQKIISRMHKLPTAIFEIWHQQTQPHLALGEKTEKQRYLRHIVNQNRLTTSQWFEKLHLSWQKFRIAASSQQNKIWKHAIWNYSWNLAVLSFMLVMQLIPSLLKFASFYCHFVTYQQAFM